MARARDTRPPGDGFLQLPEGTPDVPNYTGLPGLALGFGDNPTMNAAYNTLFSLLRNPGSMDARPRIRRQEAIGRSGQAARQANRSKAAQLGLQNAGLVDAIDTSLAVGTAQGVIQESLKEEALREETARKDLGRVLDLIINPTLTLGEISQEKRTMSNLEKERNKANQQNEIMSILGTIIGVAGLFCWVAREVYGPDNPKWLKVRHYILNVADDDLRQKYIDEGPALAERVRQNPELKEELRPVFDDFVRLAEEDLGE